MPIPSMDKFEKCEGHWRCVVRDWSKGIDDHHVFDIKIVQRSTLTKLYNFFRPLANQVSGGSDDDKDSSGGKHAELRKRPFLQRFDSSTVMAIVGLIFLCILIFVFLSIIYMPRYFPVSQRERRHSTYH